MLNISGIEVRRGSDTLRYDLRVNKGEIVAIQGTSGVGKTTLLEAVAGFVIIERGLIQWNGEALTNVPANLRPVSMLFQDNNLFEHLSVMENLTLAGTEISQETLIAEAGKLEVEEHLSKYPTQLSGGQRQRIGLIRTMLRKEPLILLDEPFSELDAQTRQKAAQWTLHKARKKNKTMLMVTHQNEDVSRMADRVIQLT